MADNKLIAGLKEKSIDVVYTIPVIDRLLEKERNAIITGPVLFIFLSRERCLMVDELNRIIILLNPSGQARADGHIHGLN